MNDRDIEAQEDELLALESIYSQGEFSRAGSVGEIRVSLDLPQDFCVKTGDRNHAISFLPPLVLTFDLPCDYPSLSSPEFVLTCKWLSHSQLSALCQRLDEIWQDTVGRVVLFYWVKFIRDDLLDFLHIQSPLEIPVCGQSQATTSTMGSGAGESEGDSVCNERDAVCSDAGASEEAAVCSDAGASEEAAVCSDAGASEEAAVCSDAGASEEAAVCSDAGASEEAAVCSDAGASEEAAVCSDAGASEEAAVCSDAGASEEAAVCSDAGASEEAAVCSDAGASEEAAVCRDAGASEEAAVCSDAGASEEAAVCSDAGASEEAAVCSDAGASEEAAVSRDPRVISELAADTDLLLLLLEYDEREGQRAFDGQAHDCGICLMSKLGCSRFKECGHIYCNECMSEFFTVQIEEGNIHGLICPEPDCTSTATPSLVRQLVGLELFTRYDRLLLQATLDRMADVKYCPRLSCASPVILDPDSLAAVCPRCRYAFCTLCSKTYHGALNCQLPVNATTSTDSSYAELPRTAAGLQALWDDYHSGSVERKGVLEKRYGKHILELALEEALNANWKDINSKNCPSCGVAIQKNGGCNKMTCATCGQNFCWLCLGRLGNKYAYIHFLDHNLPCTAFTPLPF
ncbi:hypothetical protein DPEC_G00272010 [Dallia pectoralis]|uniref:Uncharacterized protein n=1 Tax=Dallia pectoralis TaxID=75939 RepID=A0ACC2FPW3_DALPE|nr:hypothetical protein DPEC_G00272010 [Dallia pectoralis]